MDVNGHGEVESGHRLLNLRRLSEVHKIGAQENARMDIAVVDVLQQSVVLVVR